MPPKKSAKAKAPTAAELATAAATAAIVPCIAGKKGDTWNKFEQRIDGITKQAIAARFDNAVPPLTKEEFDAILPQTLPDSAFTNDWTRDDEAALQEAWLTDPRCDDAMRGGDSSMPKNFKVLVRIFNASPFEVISPKYRLEWDTNAKDAVGPHWSVKFTSRITTIAMHPLWQRDVRLFTLALQYAVILRTKDTRPWLLSRPDDSPFFKTFEKVIGEMRDSSIVDVHEEVRSRLKRDREVIPTFSEFLLSLETIQESRQYTPLRDRSKRVYPVGVVDTKAVIDALDATDNLGFAAFLPIEYTASKILDHRIRADLDPPSARELPEYMKRAWLGYRRIEAQFRKAEQTGDSQPHAAGGSQSRLADASQLSFAGKEQLLQEISRLQSSLEQLESSHQALDGRYQEVTGQFQRLGAAYQELTAAHEELNGKYQELIDARADEARDPFEEMSPLAFPGPDQDVAPQELQVTDEIIEGELRRLIVDEEMPRRLDRVTHDTTDV